MAVLATKNGKKDFPIFEKLQSNKQWSFEKLGNSERTYITHSYHRYPAKFIPQIVEKLIQEYAPHKDDVICDPFGGCGTTLVESKILGRPSIGFDINPIAQLIAETKVEAIDPVKLDGAFKDLMARIKRNKSTKSKSHPRIDYWFPKNTQRSLSKIYSAILRTKDKKIRRFFLCGFSHILKNCSIWLMKSIKPTRDFEKITANPFQVFEHHVRQMLKKNEQFYALLGKTNHLKVKAQMKIADARKIPLLKNSVNLIITSPPYVTSYEYADLHQLSLLWLDYVNDVIQFRKKFIGTSSRSTDNDLLLPRSTEIIGALRGKDKSMSLNVNNYFQDMYLALSEMFRILKPGGKACVILGNTELKGVKILNAEVAFEQMTKIGFKMEKVIKREISQQIAAPWRDKKSGCFTGLKNKNRKRIYQHEYILIMTKPSHGK